MLLLQQTHYSSLPHTMSQSFANFIGRCQVKTSNDRYICFCVHVSTAWLLSHNQERIQVGSTLGHIATDGLCLGVKSFTLEAHKQVFVRVMKTQP
jgi:hypothetical protein